MYLNSVEIAITEGVQVQKMWRTPNGRYDKRQHSCGLAGRRLQLYDSACATWGRFRKRNLKHVKAFAAAVEA